MKENYWSDYDLRLRAECIKLKKPIPDKPERFCNINWNIPVFSGQHLTPVRDFKLWGKNLQVSIRLKNYKTNEEYWEAVRINAAKNLDALCNRHRS